MNMLCIPVFKGGEEEEEEEEVVQNRLLRIC
jgi:hypothetical protein